MAIIARLDHRVDPAQNVRRQLWQYLHRPHVSLTWSTRVAPVITVLTLTRRPAD
jgi:hypothetical protein